MERASSTVVLVVMGVSGAGKSTVSRLLADMLHWDFCEGDDLHSASAIAKMHAGHALSDDDRQGWLQQISVWVNQHLETDRHGVIAASMLKREYREPLYDSRVTFVYLSGAPHLVAERLSARCGHFMPSGLLPSQFAALEPPGADEPHIEVSVDAAPRTIVAEIVARLRLA